jgi:hypothetical protein
MIKYMAGQVTEDSTHQLIPQAVAHPIRPAYTPLNGALITSCTPNSSGNGYSLVYTLSGNTDSTVYSWTSAGLYTFNYYTVSGLTTTTYNGFIQCQVPLTNGIESSEVNHFRIFPNPVSNELHIHCSDERNVISLIIYNLQGTIVFQSNAFQSVIPVETYAKGTYLLKITGKNSSLTEKFTLN